MGINGFLLPPWKVNSYRPDVSSSKHSHCGRSTFVPTREDVHDFSKRQILKPYTTEKILFVVVVVVVVVVKKKNNNTYTEKMIWGTYLRLHSGLEYAVLYISVLMAFIQKGQLEIKRHTSTH